MSHRHSCRSRPSQWGTRTLTYTLLRLHTSGSGKPRMKPELLGGSGGLSKWVNKGDKWSYYMGYRGY